MKHAKLLKKVKRIAAWGLLEMMVALAIFGVAIISITAMNAKSFNKIKDNELTDQSNRIMVSAAEFWKSPVQEVQNQLPTVKGAGPTYYKLSDIDHSNLIDPATATTKWAWVPASSNGLFNLGETGHDCGTAYTDEYKATFISSGTPDTFLFCLQVSAEKKDFGYLITSRVSYKLGGQIKNNQIIAYRPFTYAD